MLSALFAFTNLVIFYVMQSGEEEKMVEVRDIQLVELEILKEVDRICEENHLQYAMSFGTFLGAVRHQGFIPWDDDADLYMLDKDVKNIEKYINKEKFFLQSNVSDPELPWTFYKVRRNGTLMEEELVKCLNIHKGVWIDIFPLFPAGKGKIAKKIQYFISQVCCSFRCRFVNARSENSQMGGGTPLQTSAVALPCY